MPIKLLMPEDEGLHPHVDVPFWQESVFITWRDAASGLAGTHRIGVQQDRGMANLWCGVYHDRDTVFRMNMEDVPFAQLPAGVHGMACGPQRIFHDGQHLRLQLDTPECSMDMVIDDYPNSIEYFDDGGKMFIYASHYNLQHGIRGTVTLNGIPRDVRGGLGWRDHSRGPRRWNNILGHRSLSGNFGPDFNIHVMAMLTEEGTIMRRGLLVRDGVREALDKFTLRVEILEDGITPVRSWCHVFPQDGRMITFGCTMQKGVFAGNQNYMGYFGTGACHFDGHADGFAHFELTNNPRLGTHPFGLGIANTLTNGYFEADVAEWNYAPL